jgi:hypothetical protein
LNLFWTNIRVPRVTRVFDKSLWGVQMRTVNGTQISCLQMSEVEVENAAQFFHFGKSSVVALVDNDPDASQDWCPELGCPFDHEAETVRDAFSGERIRPEAKARLAARGVFIGPFYLSHAFIYLSSYISYHAPCLLSNIQNPNKNAHLVHSSKMTQTRAPSYRRARTGATSWGAPLTTKRRRCGTPSRAKEFALRPKPGSQRGEFLSVHSISLMLSSTFYLTSI